MKAYSDLVHIMKSTDPRTKAGLPAAPFQLQEAHVTQGAPAGLIRRANSAPRPSATNDPAGQRTETGLKGTKNLH